MFCKKCGKEISDDSVFCPYCSENTGLEADKKSQKTNKSLMHVIIACVAVIVILIVVIAFMAGKNSGEKESAEPETEISQEIKETTEPMISESAESFSETTEPKTTSATEKTTKKTSKATTSQKKKTVKCYSGTSIPDFGAYYGFEARIYEPYSPEGMVEYETSMSGYEMLVRLLEENGFRFQSEEDEMRTYVSSSGNSVRIMENAVFENGNNTYYLKIISTELLNYCLNNYNIANNGI